MELNVKKMKLNMAKIVVWKSLKENWVKFEN